MDKKQLDLIKFKEYYQLHNLDQNYTINRIGRFMATILI